MNGVIGRPAIMAFNLDTEIVLTQLLLMQLVTMKHNRSNYVQMILPMTRRLG